MSFLLVYRPPHQLVDTDENLYTKLSEYIDGKLCVVAGDLNCRINWVDRTADAEGMRLITFCDNNFLTQFVDQPTRGANILDLVLATEEDLVSTLTVDEALGNSDHKMVRFNIHTPNKDREEKSHVMLNYRRANFNGFKDSLTGLVTPAVEDIDEMWQGFKSKFLELQARFIPTRSMSSSSKCHPKWFNRDIAEAIRARKRAYRETKASTSIVSIDCYNRAKREVKSMVRNAKRNEEIRVASIAKVNPKEFFAHVNSRKPIKSCIGLLTDEQGHSISGDIGIAQVLNNFFVTVFTGENIGDIPIPVIRYDGNTPLTSIVCTVEEVTQKLAKLNRFKSPGPDDILPRVLKEVGAQTVPHLLIIYNKSLELGLVPKDWKLANVTPIFKKGDRECPGNYRPISLTSIVGKMLESIVADRLVEHLDLNGLIGNSQHGFRRHRSCLTNLLEFFHNIFSMYDRTRAVDVLYLDFQKAFDKVPHGRLLAKVRALGVSGIVADWIQNWLFARSQRVVINGKASEWAPVTSGVPQGSVLGPLLFIIYINDIDVGIISKISKFADDTKLGANVENSKGVLQIQRDLDEIGNWSEKWQMPFNLDKCSVMHLGHKNPNADYTLLGRQVASTELEKDLGVLISNDLKFSKQCIEVEKKAQKLLGYIKRQFSYRNKEIVLSLYNALVRPQLEYAVQFWSPSLRKDIDRLERVQARATKLIPSLRNKGYQRRLQELGLFTLETRRLRGQLIETFKILKGIDNIDYRNLFTLNTNPTRNNGLKLELKRFRTSICGNYFTYKICNIWNDLPDAVVNSTTVEEFKTKIDVVLQNRNM